MMAMMMSIRMRLWIYAGIAVLAILAGIAIWTSAYRRGVAEQAVKAATAQAEEAKDAAKEALERGDGGFLYRDILRRARAPLPR